MEPRTESSLSVLARQGGNDKVIEKKVLLAHLAKAEAMRLGIAPNPEQIQKLAEQYCHELGLLDVQSMQYWLHEADISKVEFHAAIEDFAAVLAVEAHHRNRLDSQVDLHQRVVNARNQLLSKKT